MVADSVKKIISNDPEITKVLINNGTIKAIYKGSTSPTNEQKNYFLVEKNSNGHYHVLGPDTNYLIDEEYEDLRIFDEFCHVKQDGLWGVINKAGDYLLKPSVIDLQPFVDGVAVYRHPPKQGLISHMGEVILEPEYQEVRVVYDDVIYIKNKYMRAYGKVVDKELKLFWKEPISPPRTFADCE